MIRPLFVGAGILLMTCGRYRCSKDNKHTEPIQLERSKGTDRNSTNTCCEDRMGPDDDQLGDEPTGHGQTGRRDGPGPPTGTPGPFHIFADTCGCVPSSLGGERRPGSGWLEQSLGRLVTAAWRGWSPPYVMFYLPWSAANTTHRVPTDGIQVNITIYGLQRLTAESARLRPDSTASAVVTVPQVIVDADIAGDGRYLRRGPLQLRVSIADVRLWLTGRWGLRRTGVGRRLQLGRLVTEIELPQAPRVTSSQPADRELAALLDQLLATRLARLVWALGRKPADGVLRWIQRYINQRLLELTPGKVAENGLHLSQWYIDRHLLGLLPGRRSEDGLRWMQWYINQQLLALSPEELANSGLHWAQQEVWHLLERPAAAAVVDGAGRRQKIDVIRLVVDSLTAALTTLHHGIKG